MMNEFDLRQTKLRLAYFAQLQGFQLDEVYVEQVQAWPTAFEALVDAASSRELSGVLLPSILHFAMLGPPGLIKKHFEHTTRTRVFTVSELVSFKPGEAAS